jgi:hypothetical protein
LKLAAKPVPLIRRRTSRPFTKGTGYAQAPPPRSIGDDPGPFPDGAASGSIAITVRFAGRSRYARKNQLICNFGMIVQSKDDEFRRSTTLAIRPIEHREIEPVVIRSSDARNEESVVSG